MLTLMPIRGRHVAMVDIKGAFLKAKVPDELELIVEMSGELMNLMYEIDPGMKQGEEHKVLYLRFKKALYGYIEAARLFFDDLNHTLVEKMKFKRNEYDPCVYY